MDDGALTFDRGACVAREPAGETTPMAIPEPTEFPSVIVMPEADLPPQPVDDVQPADDARASGAALPALVEDEPSGEPEEALPIVRPTAHAAEPDPEQILEAILFAADAPLSLNRLTELLGECSPTEVRLHLAALNDKYTMARLSFRVEEIARGYQMMTLPRYQPWIAKLNQQRSQTRLSPAALETLAIIAYKRPIIRADVEAIRGVACGEVITRLRDMGLIRITGRAEVVGRPLLYDVTKKFLDVFGLADLEDLPPMEALTLRRPASAPEPVTTLPQPDRPLAASA